MRPRSVLVILGAGLFGLVGPRFSHPHDRPAEGPFDYVPPEGFVPSAEKRDEGTRAVWRRDDRAPSGFAPRVSLSRVVSRGTVEERDLAQIAEELPKTFAGEGIEWSHRRHETRTRADGGRVGLIEGACVKRSEGFAGYGTREIRFRRLQLVFPENEGTSIVTAQFAEQDAAELEPAFEASIARARGVATRVPSPSGWVFAAWGGAGAVLAWMIGALAESISTGRRRDEGARAGRRGADDAS